MAPSQYPLPTKVPLFGVRKFANQMVAHTIALRDEALYYKSALDRLGAFTALELEQYVAQLQHEAYRLQSETAIEIESQRNSLAREVESTRNGLTQEIASVRKTLALEVETTRNGLAHEIGNARSQLNHEIETTRYQFVTQVNELEAQKARLQEEISALEPQAINLREITFAQDYGLYDYEHPAESSVELAEQLRDLRVKIRNANKAGAYSATSSFTFNGSQKEGDKFVKQMGKMLLSSYNAEAENCVKSVKAGNIATAKQRLVKAKTRIEQNGTMIDLAIKDTYHRLRIKELELADAHMQQVKREREEEREHRAQLREQAKVAAEIKAAREKLEKERKHKQNVLAAVAARIQEAEAAGIPPSQEDIAIKEEYTESIQEILAAEEDVNQRNANMRAGYIYVISNVGSLGEGVVKIGMTRRLDPLDRIKELSGASVPFGFDVHALFFDEDAYGTEAMLHREFAHRRVNLINTRREHFYATPAEVLQVLRTQSNAAIVEYTLEAPAEDYYASNEIRKQLMAQQPNTQE